MRKEWILKCPLAQVKGGAKMKAEHHREREQFWADELVKAEADLKASTVTFEDAAVTGGHDVRTVIDPSKSARYGECKRKKAKHQESLEEYERWIRALEYVHDTDLELEISDVEFFGL